MNEDNVFCHEIAKRSVARAALHLGIDSMSEDALNVMGDVLLAYLERMGRNLSSLVESSGRSSAHVNVLDAFRAVEASTSPAVHQLHMNPEERTTTGAVDGWQDLAEFCFGPDWLQEQEQQEEQPKKTPQEPPPGKGKVMVTDAAENDAAPAPQKKTGWEAPYLDEVPTFPQTTSLAVANPHRLPSNVALSLHQAEEEIGNTKADVAKDAEQQAERELKGVPDDVFTTPWGEAADNDSAALNSRKRKAQPSDKKEEEGGSSPPTKRTKLDEKKEIAVASKQAPATVTDKLLTRKRPAYVPSFCPPFPQPKTAGRAVMDVDEIAPPQHIHKSSSTTIEDGDGQLGLRSSLVKLGGQHYWGSGWDQAETAASSTTALKVPLGRPEGGGADTPSIVPLGRASGSRISRILEGSMDAVG